MSSVLKHLYRCNGEIEQLKKTYDESPVPSYDGGVLASYEDGSVGQCYISHVIDEVESLCYILDVARMPDTKSFEGRIRPLNRLPKIGEIFAYNFHGQFMIRAKRIVELDPLNDSSFSAQFIDIGCTIWIDMNDIEYFFEIDQAAKRVPPCAIKCSVLKLPADRSLITTLHSKMDFRIEKMGNALLYIELSSHETAPLSPNIIGSDSDFYAFFEWDWNKQQSTEKNSDFSSNFHVNLEHFDGVQVFAKKKSKRMFIRQILAERYDTKDETNAAADEVNASKWKVHSDRMEQFADTLGLEDEKPAHVVVPPFEVTDLCPVPFWPKAGTAVRITSHFVRDVERFYAFVPKCYREDVLTPDQLTTAMNIDRNRSSFIKLTEVPDVDEHVLATFCDKVYRARVARHYDKVNFQVYFLDFGNCSNVSLANGVFRWDARWNAIPPLAITCLLRGVEKACEFDYMGINVMEKALLNGPVDAEVVDVVESMDTKALVLNVRDKDGDDLAEFLIAKGFSNKP